jgi:hypothetical protein
MLQKAMSPEADRRWCDPECSRDGGHTTPCTQHEEDAAAQHDARGERPLPRPSREQLTIRPREPDDHWAFRDGGYLCNIRGASSLPDDKGPIRHDFGLLE